MASRIGSERAALLGACALALGMAACASADHVEGTAPADAAAIDAYFAGLRQPVTNAPSRRDGSPSPDFQSGDYLCQTVPIAHTRPYDTFVAYDAERLAPGAILPGDVLERGTFVPVDIARARLAESVVASSRADATLAIEPVDSIGQLDLALGAQASWHGSVDRVREAFDFEAANVRSRFLVRYAMPSYRVDVEAPRPASWFFAPAVDLEEVRSKMPPELVPAYVASMTYGHAMLFAIESPYSYEETWPALHEALEDAPEHVSPLSPVRGDDVAGMRIRAFVLGGSGEGWGATDYDTIREVTRGGTEAWADVEPTPIAFTLRDIRDDAPRTMTLSRDFDFRTCERIR